MKGLLLDQGLPRSATRLLVELGFVAVHVADVDMSEASDREILEYARAQNLIVVTLDADFHMLLAAIGAASPSVIRLRQQGLSGKEAAVVIRTVLERGYEMLDRGAVASATKASIRFKRLPLQRTK